MSGDNRLESSWQTETSKRMVGVDWMPGRLVSNVSDSVDDPERFGFKLRRAREEKGLSQIELAEMAGYSNGWISSVERGVSVPTGTFARRMEVVLGTELGVSKLLLELSSHRRGSVGSWGVTPTEVSGFVGLSRTRIYGLMNVFTNAIGGRAGDPDLFNSVWWEENDGRGYLAWVNIDGLQRIRRTEVARFVVTDRLKMSGLTIESISIDEYWERVAEVLTDLNDWLDKKRRI